MFRGSQASHYLTIETATSLLFSSLLFFIRSGSARMLHRLRQWLCPDLAIDLGTANTIVAIQGEGIALDEPPSLRCIRGPARFWEMEPQLVS